MCQAVHLLGTRDKKVNGTDLVPVPMNHMHCPYTDCLLSGPWACHGDKALEVWERGPSPSLSTSHFIYLTPIFLVQVFIYLFFSSYLHWSDI